jgi:hypothetical protein
MRFGLGAGGAHLGLVVLLGGTRMGATSFMACTCLPKRVSKGRQTLLPCDDSVLSGSISWARSLSCSSMITAKEGTDEGTEALHQLISKGYCHDKEISQTNASFPLAKQPQ